VKRKWKVLITVVVLLIAAIGVWAGAVYSKRGTVTVQTGKAVRQDLVSQVTASGEIKPKNYINIGANAIGELTQIAVKEGDRVHKGQLLARIEDVQPKADLEAQKATLSSAEADSSASEASLKAADQAVALANAAIDQSRAEMDRAKADYDRTEAQFKEGLLARQEYDLRKYTYEAQKAAVTQAQTRLAQARAQREQAAAALASSQKRIALAKANYTRFNDVLEKRNSFAPIDGVVTNLPVRVGETVVPGLQNQSGTLIMTIADMSLITAEVKVDETDIVNVKLGQPAEITIDELGPNKKFPGT
jgi:HlyD family secretion protein